MNSINLLFVFRRGNINKSCLHKYETDSIKIKKVTIIFSSKTLVKIPQNPDFRGVFSGRDIDDPEAEDEENPDEI